MRSLILSIALLGAALAPADDRAGVDRQYAKLKSAFWAMNHKKAMSVIGSNFVWIKPMGERVGYRQYSADLKKMFAAPGLNFQVVDMKNDSYSFTGDEAMVRSAKHISYSQRINGRNVTAHKMMNTVDTWRRSPAGWKLYKVQVLSQEEHNDGG